MRAEFGQDKESQTTGYREYMEDAFDVNAFHYLVKPVDEKKFHTVLHREFNGA